MPRSEGTFGAGTGRSPGEHLTTAWPPTLDRVAGASPGGGRSLRHRLGTLSTMTRSRNRGVGFDPLPRVWVDAGACLRLVAGAAQVASHNLVRRRSAGSTRRRLRPIDVDDRLARAGAYDHDPRFDLGQVALAVNTPQGTNEGTADSADTKRPRFTLRIGARRRNWYRIPDARYSVPCVPPRSRWATMCGMGRMGHDR